MAVGIYGIIFFKGRFHPFLDTQCTEIYVGGLLSFATFVVVDDVD